MKDFLVYSEARASSYSINEFLRMPLFSSSSKNSSESLREDGLRLSLVGLEAVESPYEIFDPSRVEAVVRRFILY